MSMQIAVFQLPLYMIFQRFLAVPLKQTASLYLLRFLIPVP